MNLYYLNSLLEKEPTFQLLLNRLRKGNETLLSLRLPEQAYSFLAASIYGALGKPVLFVTAHPETARRRFEQVKLWMKAVDSACFFPEVDLLSSTASLDPVVNSERLKILSLLLNYDSQEQDINLPPFILVSALSLISRSIPKNEFKSGCFEIVRGSNISQSALLERLQKMGYEYEEVIEIPCTFGKRGGIIDVFPGGSQSPARIEFFGDKIESIREYDPKTQRSNILIPTLIIPPAKELSTSGMANILDYMPKESILVLDDPEQIKVEVEKIKAEIVDLKSSNDDNGINTRKEFLYFGWEQIADKIGSSSRVINLSAWDMNGEDDAMEFKLPIRPAPNFAARFVVFAEQLSDLRRENNRVLIVSQQSDRVKELLLERGIEIYPASSLEHVPPENSLTMIQGSVEGGWQFESEFLLLTDLELFGITKQRRAVKTRPVRHHWFLNDINMGDLVVHTDHGIGRFAGVTRKVSAGVEKEYFVLEYAGGDTLYVPVDQVDRVSLYIGGGERTPALSRLGSQEWNRARRKVKESVVDIAGELIELYATREASNGLAFSPDTLWQGELEASFPYVETVDQLEAVRDVKADMESPRPMDRLVCGDVGYGKTEIAVRAAFKTVMDSKQVAVVVPTTILAQQHINTFSERLKTFPVKIAVLSRFCSQKEQSDIISRLAEGNIDICIGTHRLLQRDVIFKELGLVIIDEEQRFGVVHKEHFKKIRQNVDVLTLSATPIPRTMHMALSGIRDMSTIETPPENRLPINIYVGEFNNRLVREAILREIERDGQVFIVHNRVCSISNVASKIENLVPEAKVSVAHGQMDDEKLEHIMTDFMEGKSNVLVTTTIIESGLDMPNVNTLIVDSADKLGLTQLYQLRGRIGRGANSAYAYFLFDSWKKLTEQARERLKTIAQATELGAGFAIAMKDLEIRGAGNLLGVEQSGNIAAVGFNYYCQLLAEEVEEIRAKRDGRKVERKTMEPQISIDLKIPAFIPQEYIENTRTRFNVYQRLANCTEVAMVNDIAEELSDRFGGLPEEVVNLLYIVGIKQMALHADVESIFRNQELITISFSDQVVAESRLSTMPKNGAIKIGNRQVKMDMEKTGVGWKTLLKDLLQRVAAVPVDV